MKKLFIFLLTFICIPSLAAYESYITSRGYKTVSSVEVNWNYIEQLSTDTYTKIITKSKKKTAKKPNSPSPTPFSRCFCSSVCKTTLPVK